MPKQSITPALRKMFFLSTQFYSAGDLNSGMMSFSANGANNLQFKTGTFRVPELTYYDTTPMRIGGGWMFGVNCKGPASCGMVSPHQIFQPSKSTVDLQVDVWWMCGYHNVAVTAPYKVGWAVNMQMAQNSQTQPLIPFQDLMLNLAGSPFTPMGSPVVGSLADTDGHINWNYSVGNSLGASVTVNKTHPNDQWAVGYGAQAVWDGVGMYPYWPVCAYKTRVNLVKQVSGALTTDSIYSFRNISTNALNTPLALTTSLFRIIGANDGVFVDGAFGTDTNPAKFSDALTFVASGGLTDISKLAPMFVGMEITIL